MECILEANPNPEVTWFQGNKVIADSSRIKMKRTPQGKDTYLLALEISNPTKDDGGNYRCNACNACGESNANIALNFQGMSLDWHRNGNGKLTRPVVGGEEEADGGAPTFIEKPKIIPNETGTLITMKCKCRAKPAPVVTWYKDTTQVKESARIKFKTVPMENDTYELVMEIKVFPSYLWPSDDGIQGFS